MKAARIQRFGPPSVITIEDLIRPSIGLVRDVPTAREVIKRTIAEAEARLRMFAPIPLRTIEDRVKSLVASHTTSEGIIAATPTRDFDAAWGRGYVTGEIFLRMVLAGLGLTMNTGEQAHLTQ